MADTLDAAAIVGASVMAAESLPLSGVRNSRDAHSNAEAFSQQLLNIDCDCRAHAIVRLSGVAHGYAQR
eukprot:15007851-Alexandrium_andersonii.AAC.1